MWQEILVGLAIISALIFVIRRFSGKLKNKESACSCDCSRCSYSNEPHDCDSLPVESKK